MQAAHVRRGGLDELHTFAFIELHFHERILAIRSAISECVALAVFDELGKSNMLKIGAGSRLQALDPSP